MNRLTRVLPAALAIAALALLTYASASADGPTDPWEPYNATWTCPSSAGPAVIGWVPQSPPPSEVCSSLKMTVTNVSSTVCPLWGGSGGDDIDGVTETWTWGLQPTSYTLDPDPTYAYDFVESATVEFTCVP